MWLYLRAAIERKDLEDVTAHLPDRLSSLTLGRKSPFIDVQITTCLEEYPWHRSAMREMYH